jgi:AcrR family transcriptional regulator
MQKKKDTVRKKILERAKQEFIEKGYEGGSLREIASRAGVTKGNIYTYFRNKDELFCELVRPILNVIEHSLREQPDFEFIQNYIRNIDESAKISLARMSQYVHILTEYTDELKLLFFGSSGSSMAGFREIIFELYFESSKTFYKRLFELNQDFRGRVSEMLIHSMASLHLSFIEEIIVHEPNQEELKKYVEQMAIFVHFGTMNVLKSAHQRRDKK